MDNSDFVELVAKVRALIEHTHEIDVDLSIMEFHRLWTQNKSQINLPDNMKDDHNTFACFYYHYMFLRSLELANGSSLKTSDIKTFKKPVLTLVKG